MNNSLTIFWRVNLSSGPKSGRISSFDQRSILIFKHWKKKQIFSKIYCPEIELQPLQLSNHTYSKPLTFRANDTFDTKMKTSGFRFHWIKLVFIAVFNCCFNWKKHGKVLKILFYFKFVKFSSKELCKIFDNRLFHSKLAHLHQFTVFCFVLFGLVLFRTNLLLHSS